MTRSIQTCPRCGSSKLEETTMGFFGFDLNRASCYAPDCGWRGRSWETIPIGEAGNPAEPDVIRVMDPMPWQPGETVLVGERAERLLIVERVDRADGRLFRVRRQAP